MKHLFRFLIRKREEGQSLVEVAIFFPIFVILLAGLVEVSQLVVAQNKVSNAARVGARFGANGGEDDGMVVTALNSITQTLSTDPSDWDIWVIRATVDDNGTGFSAWTFEHVYGISNTVKFPSVSEPQIKADVLAELQKSGNPATAGIRVVGTHAIYDVDSILGLNAVPLVAGINSVQDLSVMRIVGFNNVVTDGCSAFPIAVHEDIRSVTPPGTGANPFPDPHDFGPGSPTPSYSDFPNHIRDVPLDQAKEGTVFKIKNGSGSGNFGWLRWNQGRPDDANTLTASLTPPGDSIDYTTPANGGSGIPGMGRVLGYVEPNDPTDTSMNIGDIVAANTGNVNAASVRSILNNHISPGPGEDSRVLRVIVWNNSNFQGNYGEYEISGFALFRLQGYDLTGNPSWILAEFIGMDNSCGQVTTGP